MTTMTVPEAVSLAKTRLAKVMPTFSADALQLEELETPPFGNKWRFTFVAMLPAMSGSSLAEIARGRRIAKTVEIDSETGDLLAVKNAAA